MDQLKLNYLVIVSYISSDSNVAMNSIHGAQHTAIFCSAVQDPYAPQM